MKKFRVPIPGTIGKSVKIETGLEPRVSALEAAIAALQDDSGTNLRHSELQGLQIGNDHPQYPLSRGRESIRGQWDFRKAIWAYLGNAATPGYAFFEAQDTGLFGSFTAGDPYFGSVVALLHFNGADGAAGPFTDSSTYARAVTVAAGTAVLDTTVVKYGSASLEAGAASQVNAAYGAEMSIATGNWTIEFWLNRGNNGGVQIIHENGSTLIPFNMTFNNSGVQADGNDGAGVSAWGTTVRYSSSTVGTWEFWSVTRNGSTFEVRKNGTVVNTTTYAGTLGENVGAWKFLATTSTSWIDDFRMTVGVARTITEAPTAQFPDSGDVTYTSVTVDGAERVRFNDGDGDVQLRADNQELQIGAGQDLRLYHDGTNSRIRNDTGDLYLMRAAINALQLATANEAIFYPLPSTGAGVSVDSATGTTADFRMLNAGVRRWVFRKDGTAESGSNAGSNFAISRRSDAGADLGSALYIIRSTGNVQLPNDSQELQIGLSQDLRLYHDGTNSIIRNDTGSLFVNLGTTEIARFVNLALQVGTGTTTTSSVSVDAANTNTCDFQMKQGALNRWIFRKTGASESGANAGSDFGIIARDDAGANLGNVMLATRATGAVSWGFGATAHHRWGFDNLELRIGAAASGDLRLFHDGTNSVIRNDTGSLILQAAAVAALTVSSGAASTFFPDVTVGGSASSDSILKFSCAAGFNRDLRFQTSGVNRWLFRCDSAAESGSNAGSNFVITPRADDGSDLAAAFQIIRSSSNVRLPKDNQELQIGAGQDLRLYHDGTNSLVRTDTGGLRLQFSTSNRLEVNTTGVGFNGATPIARPNYTITNPTTNRSIDVSTITAANLAQVVGTMIQDLIDYGLYQ